MADKKISDFTETTDIDASDLLEIENTGGNSRKITAGNLLKGGVWTLVSSTSPSGASEVDVTDLGSYNEVLVVARALTASVSGVRQIQVSTDNGSSFDTTAANYQTVSALGVEANAATAAIAYHGTNATAARTLVAHIKNLKGAVKVCTFRGAEYEILYVGSASDINAIRINNHTGGTISGGPVYVYARQ